MAKILMADGSEIRGKIGGKVYSRNASGAFVRKFVKPINKNSGLQQASRGIFASVSNAWRELTAVQRQSFEDMREFYTRIDNVGNTITPTASQLFCRLNGALMQNGLVATNTLLTSCPAPFSIVGINSVVADADISDTEMFAPVTFANATNTVPTGQSLIISATPAISNGIKSVPKNAFKRITTLAAASNTATENLWSLYVANFSEPREIDSIYLKFQQIATSTGEISSETIVRVTVVA